MIKGVSSAFIGTGTLPGQTEPSDEDSIGLFPDKSKSAPGRSAIDES
jgi:hypothetical protein